MAEREKLKLTGEEGRSILYEDHDDFELVTSEIVNNTRWSIVYEDVYLRLSDKKFLKQLIERELQKCKMSVPMNIAMLFLSKYFL